MKNRKGFTLIELMVVILIVAILAAVAIPILRGRIDAAKWSEGKASMGSIATAIRAYQAEKGPTGDPPLSIFGTTSTDLGFVAGDLNGTYFQDICYGMVFTSMDPLVFDVTCTVVGGTAEAPANPASYTLDELGQFN